MKPITRMVSRCLQCALALAVLASAGGCDDPVEPDESGPRQVLTLIYNAMGGPRWDNRDNWATDAPLDTWYGVTTNSDGDVTGLNLGYNGLTDRIPPELGNLGSLLTLDLKYNGLTGPIPPACRVERQARAQGDGVAADAEHRPLEPSHVQRKAGKRRRVQQAPAVPRVGPCGGLIEAR